MKGGAADAQQKHAQDMLTLPGVQRRRRNADFFFLEDKVPTANTAVFLLLLGARLSGYETPRSQVSYLLQKVLVEVFV